MTAPFACAAGYASIPPSWTAWGERRLFACKTFYVTGCPPRFAAVAGFGTPSRDPPNAHAVGFAHAGHLGATASALPDELEVFLNEGDPPVVIGLGWLFSLGSDDLVADAAEACAELGRRCVVVGAPTRSRVLPVGTMVVRYATYRLLFPRAAAIVIHGGPARRARRYAGEKEFQRPRRR